MEPFDLVVIGSGPAGAAAAFSARSLGLSVCLVEKADIGGACLNRGCIPTKTLLHGAALLRDAREGARYGLIAGDPSLVGLDFAKLIAWKNTVVRDLRKNQDAALVKAGVRIERGEARIEGPGKLSVAGGERQLLEGRAILVAVGTVPGRIPVAGSDLSGVYTSDDFLDGEGIFPPRLAIVGGGVIGVEFAAAYSAFGSEVTIIEALPGLLANMDREIGQSLALQFKKRGIAIKTGARITAIEKGGNGLRVLLEDGPVEADAVLMAAGRKPTLVSLFAPGCAPAFTDKGYIQVDENLMSSIPGLYAAGDITGGIGGMQLAHAAEAQGRYAAERIAGGPAGAASAGWPIPACVYTAPEIACAGLSLAEAGAQGIPAVAGKGVFGANGRAMLENMDRGFIKLVFHAETRALIGAQFFCNHATEIIPWALQCIRGSATAKEIAETVFPHPSYSETIAQAARDALGRGGL
jgi:dihydrolipoamide dehydrogenase